ncbi:MAG TPA: glycosyltransferase [Verrucomicrobiae bacterium]|nr:glycosyltransferase [Verrucomicrobiae bacterium]
MSANVGVGHVAAANAVCAALRERDPNVQTQVVDSYKYAALVVSRVVSEGYLQMVKTIPQMYRYIYSRAEKATEVGPFRTWAHQFTAGNLRPLMERERPDVVVCTHAFPCGAMAEYKKMYDDAPPVVGIVTDFAVHAFWINTDIDAYAVATPEMREQMLARGVEPQRVAVTGIPVLANFSRNGEPSATLRERLSLPQDRNVVLMMGGGLGLGPIVAMMRALETLDEPVCVVVIVGRNARLEQRVMAAARGVNYPLRVLRFVDNVFDYMHAADVLLTKPGGLTSAEALVAGVPMLLFKPLPGQEERNVRYLTEHGAAIRARKPVDLARIVRDVITDRPRRERMARATAGIARPDAAREVAATIIALAERGKVLI